MTIKNVAVVGASGNVGTPTVRALLAANFTVTAVTRPSSLASSFPSEIAIRRADFSNLASLVEAFSGQDAVVVTIASDQIANQQILATAACQAGVRRFLPSEFGHNSARLKEGTVLAGLLAGKAAMTKFLSKLADEDESKNFSWTGVATSPFFDWGLDHGVFGIDLAKRTVRMVDSGTEKVSASSLRFVGEAVVAVLRKEEETKNRMVEVVEFTVCQNQVVALVEEAAGCKLVREEGVPTGQELEKAAEDKLAKGDYGGAFFDALLAWNFKDGGVHAVPEGELDNELLGLKARDVRDVVREYVKEREGK